MLILRQWLARLYRQEGGQMSLKPTPLMDFQVHYTIAQKIVSDHNSFGHPIDKWKLILHTLGHLFLYHMFITSRYIQAKGEARKDISSPIDQCCTQWWSFFQHCKPHLHCCWSGCYLREAFWDQPLGYHSRTDHKCSSKDQTHCPQCIILHVSKTILYWPRHIW